MIPILIWVVVCRQWCLFVLVTQSVRMHASQFTRMANANHAILLLFFFFWQLAIFGRAQSFEMSHQQLLQVAAKCTFFVYLNFYLIHILLQLSYSHPNLLQRRCHVFIFKACIISLLHKLNFGSKNVWKFCRYDYKILNICWIFFLTRNANSNNLATQ